MSNTINGLPIIDPLPLLRHKTMLAFDAALTRVKRGEAVFAWVSLEMTPAEMERRVAHLYMPKPRNAR